MREVVRNIPVGITLWRIVVGLTALVCTCAVLAISPEIYPSGMKTDLAQSIAKTPEGGVLTVPAGVYLGPVVLDKPMTLVGEPGAVIDGRGDGDVVQVTAPDVTLRGFMIRNTGDILDRENSGIVITAPRATIEDNRLENVLFGIYLKNSPHSVIRRNHITSKDLDLPRRGDCIRLWASDDSVIENKTIADGRDLVMWYSKNLTVRGNTVTRCRYGIHFMYAANATVEDNQLTDNSVGMFLMYTKNLALRRNVMARNRGPSGFGLGIKDVDGADIRDNMMIDNRVGIHIDNSPSNVDITHLFRGNILAYNDIGLGMLPNVTRNRFVNNGFIDNVQQVAVFGGGAFEGNSFTVDGRGNFWGDYRGFDMNDDGLGDVEHRVASVFENLMDRQPKLRLFLYSPAQQAIESASKAFPVVQPQVRAIDTAPLMKPPDRLSVTHVRQSSYTMLTAAGLMLSGAGTVMYIGWRG
jgi:nitrous oxidase accessory protein